MKQILITLFLLTATFAHANYVPTPDMAMSIPFADDTTRWAMQGMDGNRNKILAEFTPEGQSIEAWKEMLSQEITFTKKKLEKHLVAWKVMITQADPDVIISEVQKTKDQAIYTYRSTAFNEFSIRIFMKARDGIYAQAYHIRLSEPNEDRIKLWKELILKTTLVPNPQK